MTRDTFLSWLHAHSLQTPAAILFDAYRPLGALAGELLQAFAPLLPVGEDSVTRLGAVLVDPAQQDELARDIAGTLS